MLYAKIMLNVKCKMLSYMLAASFLDGKQVNT